MHLESYVLLWFMLFSVFNGAYFRYANSDIPMSGYKFLLKAYSTVGGLVLLGALAWIAVQTTVMQALAVLALTFLGSAVFGILLGYLRIFYAGPYICFAGFFLQPVVIFFLLRQLLYLEVKVR